MYFVVVDSDKDSSENEDKKKQIAAIADRMAKTFRNNDTRSDEEFVKSLINGDE